MSARCAVDLTLGKGAEGVRSSEKSGRGGRHCNGRLCQQQLNDHQQQCSRLNGDDDALGLCCSRLARALLLSIACITPRRPTSFSFISVGPCLRL
jgi:hypothetical protein